MSTLTMRAAQEGGESQVIYGYFPKSLALLGKSTEITALTHAFPRHHLQTQNKWLIFTLFGNWKQKGSDSSVFSSKKSRCWCRSNPKTQCSTRRAVRRLHMPHGIHLSPLLSVCPHVLQQPHMDWASSASLLKAGRGGVMRNAGAAWFLHSLPAVAAC